MSYIIENSFSQGDPEWHDVRIDSVGGTGLAKIITNVNAERSKSRPKYLIKKAGDIISRDPEPSYSSWEMKWGHKYEPEARDMLSFVIGQETKTCAMIFADEKRNWHISPDCYNDELAIKWGGEIKCYQLEGFLECREKKQMPPKHNLQVQAGLALTGWDHWKFMVYFPNLAPLIFKIERDEPLIRIIKAEVNLFNRELETLVEKLKQ